MSSVFLNTNLPKPEKLIGISKDTNMEMVTNQWDVLSHNTPKAVLELVKFGCMKMCTRSALVPKTISRIQLSANVMHGAAIVARISKRPNKRTVMKTTLIKRFNFNDNLISSTVATIFNYHFFTAN